MSENKAIERLTEFKLSWHELDVLSVDQRACLSILSFAASEVNALMKLYLFSSHLPIGNEPVDRLMPIHRNTILRVWSAKVFEFSEFIKFGGKKKLTNDVTLLRLSEEGLATFNGMKNIEGFGFAQSIRHEATNHYSFSAAKSNVKHTPPDLKCDFYMHEMSGNSFYPMGEDVMFINRFLRGTGSAQVEEFSEKMRSWLNWLLEATNWLDNTVASFFEELVLRNFPDRYAREFNVWIDPALVGGSDESKVPIFLRKKLQ